MTLFNEELANTKDIFSGEIAFKLYDEIWFPFRLNRRYAKRKKSKS